MYDNVLMTCGRERRKEKNLLRDGYIEEWVRVWKSNLRENSKVVIGHGGMIYKKMNISRLFLEITFTNEHAGTMKGSSSSFQASAIDGRGEKGANKTCKI